MKRLSFVVSSYTAVRIFMPSPAAKRVCMRCDGNSGTQLGGNVSENLIRIFVQNPLQFQNDEFYG